MKRIVCVAAWIALMVGDVAYAADGSTEITLPTGGSSPAQVYNELARQSGVKFDVFPTWLFDKSDARISVQATDLKFWDAALLVGQKLGVDYDTISLSPLERTVRVSAAHAKPLPHAQFSSGPVVYTIEPSRDANATPGALDLVAYVDPAIRNFVFADEPDITQATDMRGNSLTRVNLPEHHITPPAGMITRHPLNLFVAREGIASLRGGMTMIIASQITRWDIDKPASAARVARKLGKTTYSFESLARKGDEYELKLYIKGPANGGFKAGAQDLVVGEEALQLTDAAGKRWTMTQVAAHYDARELTAIGQYRYTIRLSPERGAGEIVKLSWSIPGELSNLEVPFEFKDVPTR